MVKMNEQARDYIVPGAREADVGGPKKNARPEKAEQISSLSLQGRLWVLITMVKIENQRKQCDHRLHTSLTVDK